jgi:hypothetical protein
MRPRRTVSLCGNLLVRWGIRENCIINRKILLLYILMKLIIKAAVVFSGISLVSTNKISAIVLLSCLTLYVNDIVGRCQCELKVTDLNY